MTITGDLNAKIPTPQPSVAQMFVNRVKSTPDTIAFWQPTDPGWKKYSWRDLDQQVRSYSAGLISLGVIDNDRVAIASNTRYEWMAADFAILLAGAATTTVYPTTGIEDAAYIIADSGSIVIFAENQEQVDKYLAIKARTPRVKNIVVFDGAGDGEFVISLEELGKRGKRLLESNPNVVNDHIARVTGDTLATLIYTSGTTGKPKGVELMHKGFTYQAASIESLGILTSEDVQLLWLPLAHSFGKVLSVLHLQIGFQTALDGRVPKIVENLGDVKPTFMAAVPRIFEKVHAKVTADVAYAGGAKEKIFNWAFKVGTKAALSGDLDKGKKSPAYKIAEKLVFHKLHERFGGRIRYFISGAAALSTDINTWFAAANLKILEGWGLTESGPATAMSRPWETAIGYVGEPFPGTQVKLASDGELLIKGPALMRGYHNLSEENAKAFDADGWLYTGDIGEIDANGRIKITDRKRDVVKTSSGKFVAPTTIEVKFKAVTQIASHILVVAANRNFVSALIALDPEGLQAFAERNKLSGSYDELRVNPAVIEHLQQEIDTLNAGLNGWEQVKQFRVLPRDLSIEADELTPSLKVRRSRVMQKYQDLVDGIYSESAKTA
ncbi:MAG: long-chain fatty acid--CoA ligase [Actinobacteria bacterium]|nr:long-chain fatty acid--CoA ligase [Actinomycetota bacterium]